MHLYYGVQLADYYLEKYSPRYLMVRIENLPAESSFKQAVAPEEMAWSIETHMLANIFDILASANWQRAVASGKKGVRKPKPIKRPGQKGAGRRIGDTTGRSPLEVREFLDTLKPVS